MQIARQRHHTIVLLQFLSLNLFQLQTEKQAVGILRGLYFAFTENKH